MKITTTPIAAVIGVSVGAALVSVLAPAAANATPPTAATVAAVAAVAAAQPSDQADTSGLPGRQVDVDFRGYLTNNLPFAVNVVGQHGSIVHVEPGQRMSLGEAKAVGNTITVYAAGAPTPTVVVSLQKYARSESVDGSFFLISAPNRDGSPFYQRTPPGDPYTDITTTTGFPSGRVIATQPSRFQTYPRPDIPDEVTLGGRADLPAAGSDLTVINNSHRLIRFHDAILDRGKSQTTTFNPSRTADIADVLGVPTDGGPWAYTDIRFVQTQDRNEANLSFTSRTKPEPLLAADVRDQQNQVFGTIPAGDNDTIYTVAREWDSNGKAHFTVTIRSTR